MSIPTPGGRAGERFIIPLSWASHAFVRLADKNGVPVNDTLQVRPRFHETLTVQLSSDLRVVHCLAQNDLPTDAFSQRADGNDDPEDISRQVCLSAIIYSYDLMKFSLVQISSGRVNGEKTK